ncbi:MAG: zf-HC2 domain-containing protein [Candidatus Dormibacteria bacterium]
MKKCQPRSLTPYLDGELTAETRQRVEEHLQGCPACGALLDEVTSARERVEGMGRAVVPNTVLMPALEAFRERSGIGAARQLELGDIPVPGLPGATAEESVAEPAPSVESWSPEGFEAPGVVAEAPGEYTITDAAWQAVPTAGELISQAPTEPPAEEWMELSGGVSDEAPTETDLAPPLPDFPPLPQSPLLVDDAVSGHPAIAAVPDDAAVLPDPAPSPPEPLPVVPEPDVSEPFVLASSFSEPGAAPTEAEPTDVAADPPADGAALDVLPDAPIPNAPPPWLEAEAADAEDMEARGRLVVAEDLAAQSEAPPPEATETTETTEAVEAVEAAEAPEPEPGDELEPPAAALIPEIREKPEMPEPFIAMPASSFAGEVPPVVEPVWMESPFHLPAAEHAFEPGSPVLPAAQHLEPELEAAMPEEVPVTGSGAGLEDAVARMRQELEPAAEPAPLSTEPAATGTLPDPRQDAATGYREALRARSERERPAGLAALDPQVKLGLGAAAVILIVVVGALLLPRVLAHPSRSVAVTTVHSPAPRKSAAPPPPPVGAAAPAPEPTPSAVASAPALSGVVTAGGTGTGFHATRIRTGNPAPGVYRIVFDLDGGGGGLPDAQLGRAADGTLYLQSSGMAVDASVLSSFQGVGPVTAITAGPGTNLRLSTSGQPQYSLYFLTGPARLVLDLK